MATLPSAFGPKPQFFDAAGRPDLSYQLFTYRAGSNTKVVTYTDAGGLSANTNPILLNALGQTPNGYFWQSGLFYKAVLAPATDTDPPTSPIWTIDNLQPMNDAPASPPDEWIAYSGTPVFINATTFTVAGNQTSIFQPGRRVKTLNSSGTVYGTVISSVFGAVTTVVVAGGALDSGLVGVSYGLLGATNPSVPAFLYGYASLYQFMTAEQIADVALATPLLDMSPTIQAAITACYGKKLIIPQKNYRLNTAVNILQRIEIEFDGSAQFMLATQNMNGIVIGDGTDPTRTATFGTILRNPSFAPYPGVTQFTSGDCIYENYVAFVTVIQPSFYGLDAGVKKLFNGLHQLRATECETPFLLAQQLHGSGWYAEGQAGVANRTVDSNCHSMRVLSCDGDCVYWGANTAGLGAYMPIMYSNVGWGFHINSTSGANGQNYFITDPDIEILTGSTNGGIYVQGGGRVLISGGWIGGNVSGGALPVGVRFGAGSDSCDLNISMSNARVLMEGPANKISGGEYSGDSATAGVGILISGNDNVISSGVVVRQFVGTGIDISGTPQRLSIAASQFKNNGTDIGPIGAYTARLGPIIQRCQTDKATTYAAAATVAIPLTVNFASITGATTINTIPPSGPESQLTLQAGVGGITLGAAGNLLLKSPPVAVPAGYTITLICDGVTWFESGRSF